MDKEVFLPWRGIRHKGLNRRKFIGASAGAAGAGLVLGSGLGISAFAQEAAQQSCPDLPRPIPHITTPPGQHFFFPGPVDADPMASPNKGHDPSVITDFKGMIGQADLFFTGTGTRLDTGESKPYGFHTDWRFMSGVFIGVDGLQHNGTLSFI